MSLLQHYAARNGNTELVGDLLSCGANVNARTTHGAATVRPRRCQVPAGLRCVTSPDAFSWPTPHAPRQPLHRAAGQGQAAAVRVLLAAKADRLAVDADGETPLHKAARANAADVCAVLLDGAAAADALRAVRNRRGEAAADLATGDALRALLSPAP